MRATTCVLVFLFAVLFFERFELCHCRTYSTNVSCIQSEQKALVKFKQTLTDHSKRLSSWVGEDCCSWKGVGCSKGTGHVLKLDLGIPYQTFNDNGDCKNCLEGEINPSLLDLKHLQYLDLSMNIFSTAQIPSFLGSLKKLKYLNLSSADFTGNIPHHLGNLSSLQYLDLSSSDNFLNVDNLQWVSTLSSLKHLDLSGVTFSNATDWLQSINMLSFLVELRLSSCGLQNIPPSFHVNFTSLAVLDLNDNNFNSTIPRWLFNISKIQHLDLGDTDIRGSIPSEVGNCSLLTVLRLAENELEGKIPTSVRNLYNLLEFDLSFNGFSGLIPIDQLEHFKNLEKLDLSANSFFGPIPASVGKLSSLRELDLSFNQLNRPIPASVGKLSSLRELDLSYNQLNGSIPESLGQLSNLERLDVSNNKLDGRVSELHFAKLVALTDLSMSSNSLVWHVGSTWVPPFQLQFMDMSSCKMGPQFPHWLQTQRNISQLSMSNASISDTIPDWFENISSNIVSLDLSYNQISGNLPKFHKYAVVQEIYLASNNFEGPLTAFSSGVFGLDLSNNSLSGHIPHTIGNLMPELEYLYLSKNHFNGTITDCFCKMEGITILDLSKNQLSGRLPQCWGNLQDVYVLDLSHNNLSGYIPNSLGSLQGLESVHLHNNRLHGEPFPVLKKQTHLMTLDLSENAFTGVIPSWIGNGWSLTILNLQSNNFHGEIPPQLCHCDSLRVLNLAQNNFTGTIPHCFGNFTAMASDAGTYGGDASLYNYEENTLLSMKGIQLEYTKTLLWLISIDLSSNDLGGEVPEELIGLLGLQNLNLSGNNLKGKIPSEIGNLKQLESLDFSRNELSGPIPPSMSTLNFLSYLNLSFNNLSGPIPRGNQLQTLNDESIYIGNNGLCGPPLPKSCPGDEPSGSHENVGEKGGDEFEIRWFYAGLAPGFAVGFLGVCIILYFNKSWRYALFQSIDNIYDKLSVTIAVKAVWLQRKFHKREL